MPQRTNKTGKRGRAPGKRLTDAEAEVVAQFVYDFTVPISDNVERVGIDAVAGELGYDDRTQLSRFINGHRAMSFPRWDRLLRIILRSDRIAYERLMAAASAETHRDMARAGLLLYHEAPRGGRGKAVAVAL